jgi:hypothetical protein
MITLSKVVNAVFARASIKSVTLEHDQTDVVGGMFIETVNARGVIRTHGMPYVVVRKRFKPTPDQEKLALWNFLDKMTADLGLGKLHAVFFQETLYSFDDRK